MVALAKARSLRYIIAHTLYTFPHTMKAAPATLAPNPDGALYHDPNESRSTSTIHSRQWTLTGASRRNWRTLRQVWESRWVAIPVRITLTMERRKHGMMELAKRFWNDESGQGLAEYALLLGLIVVGVVILIQGMGVSIKNIFAKANSELKTAATPVP